LALWLLAFLLLLPIPRALAQGVPGAPKGDWLAYEVQPFGVGYLERCGGTPAQLAEWRRTVEAVAAIIVTNPALADLTGYNPRLATSHAFTGPGGQSDCRKYVFEGSISFWPWLNKHVDPIPGAGAAGPKFRLKKQWVNNGFGGMWTMINAVPRFEGNAWQKDERGLFFEQPEKQREIKGFPVYDNRLYITRPDHPPLFLPVSQERVIKAFLVYARAQAPLTGSMIASMKKQYEDFIGPASQEARRKKIEIEAASQKNPVSSAQARKQAEAIDRRREEDYRKRANPAPDDPVFEPARRLRDAEALLAGMAEAQRQAPAWRNRGPAKGIPLDLRPAGAPGARPVVEVNPVFFDVSGSRTALRNVVVRLSLDDLDRTLGTSDGDLMAKLRRGVSLETDWNRVMQLMEPPSAAR
jgi:hypothetical protein